MYRFVPEDPLLQRPFNDMEDSGTQDVTFNPREWSSADGKLTFSFDRPLQTSDVHDIQVNDEKLYLLFAHGTTVGGDLSYHGYRQKWSSPRRYCFSPGCCKLNRITRKSVFADSDQV